MGTMMRRTSSVLSITRPGTPSSETQSQTQSQSQPEPPTPPLPALSPPPAIQNNGLPSPIAESPAREAAASADELPIPAGPVSSPLAREEPETEPAPMLPSSSTNPGAFTDEPEEMSLKSHDAHAHLESVVAKDDDRAPVTANEEDPAPATADVDEPVAVAEPAEQVPDLAPALESEPVAIASEASKESDHEEEPSPPTREVDPIPQAPSDLSIRDGAGAYFDLPAPQTEDPYATKEAIIDEVPDTAPLASESTVHIAILQPQEREAASDSHPVAMPIPIPSASVPDASVPSYDLFGNKDIWADYNAPADGNGHAHHVESGNGHVE